MAIEDGLIDSVTLRAHSPDGPDGEAVYAGDEGVGGTAVTLAARVVLLGSPFTRGEAAQQPIANLGRKVIVLTNPDLTTPKGDVRKLDIGDAIDVASEGVRLLASGPMRAIRDNDGAVVYWRADVAGAAP